MLFRSQVLVALLPLYVDSRFIGTEQNNSHSLVFNTLHKLEKYLDENDAGLWEFRHISQYHCYTALFHWAGANAAYKIGRHLKDDTMTSLASRLIQESSAKIEACLDKERGVYTNAIGSPHLDASTMQLIMMGYLDPNSELARSHLRNLEKELKTPEGLFYRYRHADDFGTPETTFLICSFWYIEALACEIGRAHV